MRWLRSQEKFSISSVDWRSVSIRTPQLRVLAVSIIGILLMCYVPLVSGSYALATIAIVVAGIVATVAVGLFTRESYTWRSALLQIAIALLFALASAGYVSLTSSFPAISPSLAALGITAVIAALAAVSALTPPDPSQSADMAEQVASALRESETHYRLIAENTKDLIALLDTGGGFLYASPSYTNEMGYASVMLIGASYYDYVHPSDMPQTRAQFEQALRGVPAQSVYRLGRADGTWRWMEGRVTYASDQGDGYLVLVARDMTEQRALEQQLHQAQKMEAIGRLAGGVAHDFNNLLQIIHGCTDILQEALPTDHPAHEDLAAVEQASQRAAGLTRQLLAFARRQLISPQPVDIGTIVSDLSRMLERLLGEDVELETVIDADIWRIMADPGQIEQVIVNLAVNARDAMPKGGRLRITVRNMLHRQYGADSDESAYVCLEIADTGIGMSAETQEHLFEPFYTTKTPDKGTGLGLATCYGIITQLHGKIEVQSTLGEGTSFAVMLPRITAAAAEAAAPTPPVALSGGTILVVEDERLVREMIVRAANKYQYTVLEAADADQALALVHTYPGLIDLLVTDVVLPGKNGVQLAVELSGVYPSIQVLLISGYTEHVQIIENLLTAGVAFLPKPFSPATLGSKLHDLFRKA